MCHARSLQRDDDAPRRPRWRAFASPPTACHLCTSLPAAGASVRRPAARRDGPAESSSTPARGRDDVDRARTQEQGTAVQEREDAEGEGCARRAGRMERGRVAACDAGSLCGGEVGACGCDRPGRTVGVGVAGRERGGGGADGDAYLSK